MEEKINESSFKKNINIEISTELLSTKKGRLCNKKTLDLKTFKLDWSKRVLIKFIITSSFYLSL